MLILAFPDFEWWWMAWFALVPLMWAVERENGSFLRSFLLGWLFGTTFFFGTCWWLTYAPIHYAGFPWPLAYFLMLLVSVAVGIFPAIFAGILAVLIRRFGSWALFAAPFVWVFTEFLRYWLTGNNWNAVGYSQAFNHLFFFHASVAGIFAVSFATALISSVSLFLLASLGQINWWRMALLAATASGLILLGTLFLSAHYNPPLKRQFSEGTDDVLAIQPNVPMSDLDQTSWSRLRQRQTDLAETRMQAYNEQRIPPPAGSFENRFVLVVFPESPMNFMYSDDREFQQFIGDFARRNNVSVLFNSAEPDIGTTKYFNSAVMVGPDGRKVNEYDKIYLLPFGEAVPPPFEGILPGFVGNFAYGREYDLFPVGDAKAGIMICFESHFGALSREYVRSGADVLIEMTNDGYLGPTPVLRQHLANTVFRAVETNRPVLRVTNVGITAYINEKGAVLEAAQPYQEDTRVWSVSKSDGSQTFYVKYGDWFAWLCTIVTVGLLILSFRRKREVAEARA